jgi:16S rRNA (guanine527-N7)-methyltransferase
MDDIILIEKYFDLTAEQRRRFERMKDLYMEWNARINLISRKDTDHFYLHHVLHSLAVAKFVEFLPGAAVMDAGTGGGFPGIPLAVMFPETSFVLVDSIAKKLRAVEDIARRLELDNVQVVHQRLEKHKGLYDFVVSRAVAPMPKLVAWTRKNIARRSKHPVPNGLIALKGGDLEAELRGLRNVQIIPVSRYFEEEYFRTKKIVYWPVS